MLSFGDPTPFTGRIKDAGCRIICQVQTLAQAKEAAAAGADIIIAQGRDAGGHSGMTRGTMGLVPAVVDAVAPIPVVAAGGIADGRGLAAALALGAAGVSMGTRFTASRESLWDQGMKAAALAAGGDQTEQTRVFDVVRGAPWPAIYPGRALRNAFSARWHGREEALAADRQAQEKRLSGDGAGRFRHARRLGRRGCGSGQRHPARIRDHRADHGAGGGDPDAGSPHGPRDRIAFGLNIIRYISVNLMPTTPTGTPVIARSRERRVTISDRAVWRQRHLHVWMRIARSARNDRQT